METLCFTFVHVWAAILLGSLKLPHEEIKRRIVEVDEENLPVAVVEQLIKYLPAQDQMNQLSALKDEYRSLAEPEQFGITVSPKHRFFVLLLFLP